MLFLFLHALLAMLVQNLLSLAAAIFAVRLHYLACLPIHGCPASLIASSSEGAVQYCAPLSPPPLWLLPQPRHGRG